MEKFVHFLHFLIFFTNCTHGLLDGLLHEYDSQWFTSKVSFNIHLSKWKYIPYNVNVAGQTYRNINIASIDIES